MNKKDIQILTEAYSHIHEAEVGTMPIDPKYNIASAESAPGMAKVDKALELSNPKDVGKNAEKSTNKKIINELKELVKSLQNARRGYNSGEWGEGWEAGMTSASYQLEELISQL